MKSTRSVFRGLVLSAPFVLGASVAFAQSTSSVAGTVTDTTGAAVPGASVLIHGIATGAERKTVTDGSGNFNAPSLQPGSYTVTVTAPGFSTFTLQQVTLEVNASATVNAKLTVGGSAETVQVESTQAVIEAQTSTVGQVIDREVVQQIPLNGRHFLDLTNLTPGTVVPPNNGSLTAPSRGLGSNGFVTAGAREDSNNFQINGINLNDMTQNQITFQPSINTTSEFKIINSTFSAEYGRSSGSIVNVSTRSGTNQFHGEGFDYLRNNYFDARNFFNRKGTRQNQLDRNNFGGALGGPILKDKTFFFISYEGLRQKQAILLTSNVPTTAQRAAFATSAAGTAYAQIINLIPVGTQSTNAAGQAVATASGSAPGPVKTDQFSGDLFHNISKSDTLHLYYAWQQDARTEPNLQGNTIAGFGDHRGAHRQIGTINEIHVFSPAIVNEARIGFNRIAISFNENFLGNSSTYGINNGVTLPLGLPQISVTDLGLNFGGPSGFPQGRFVTTGVFSDTLNILKGKHSIKVGGEFRRFEGNNFSETAGTIAFSTTANFANGLANTFSANSSNVVSRIFDSSVAGFVQDNWKLTPRLVVELGLRFEWNGTFTEGAHRFVNFLAASDTLQQVNQPYNQNYNYDPRVGFTYDLLGNSKTVLRGGFGILADQPNEGVASGLAGNPPNSSPVSLTGGTSSTGVGGFAVGSLYTAAALVGLTPSAVSPNLRNAYMESYNLNLQQDLGFGTVLQVGYIGSSGRHLRDPLNINQFNHPTPTTNVRPFAALSTASLIRPGASLGNITQVANASMSNYNALWVTARKQLRGGLDLNASYTLSKSLDDNSLGTNGHQDSTNPAGDYGRSDFDTRHHFVFSGVWTLPFHGNRFKEGWLLANITQVQSNNPINVVTSNTSYTGSGNIRPTLIGKYSTGRGALLTSGNIPWITGSVCTTPTAGCTFYTQATGFGNLSRNALNGPDFSDTDLSLQKTTKIAESVNLVLRLDSFDLLNHVNLANPNLTGATTGTFGQITATRNQVGDAGSSRQLQFAGKITF
ncbi:TonB-dependent receptor [Granulicella tundricola]|uniref:Cna B domain-containing protein n=1 Tax=Granulicella tundricola (strain ATCC BAA-1859 / DSM 23138 / MP5ACTX9) TaxID=1198114 RepID=E8X213_GRATM|nr:carboxypeptidase regulatory-like domain-containing protein [Granulicella tundricola]ADW70256.1 Cna B domain-containing protein [Granulicella tundricola MP5ACTX9]